MVYSKKHVDLDVWQVFCLKNSFCDFRAGRNAKEKWEVCFKISLWEDEKFPSEEIMGHWEKLNQHWKHDWRWGICYLYTKSFGSYGYIVRRENAPTEGADKL